MSIPADLTFADLALELDDAGGLHFLPGPLRTMAGHNGLDADETIASEDLSCALIAEWYLAHRIEGGEPDAAAETVLPFRNDRDSVTPCRICSRTARAI